MKNQTLKTFALCT